jgi:hypothetical protein
MKDEMKYWVQLFNIFLLANLLSHIFGITWYVIGEYEFNNGL